MRKNIRLVLASMLAVMLGIGVFAAVGTTGISMDLGVHAESSSKSTPTIHQLNDGYSLVVPSWYSDPIVEPMAQWLERSEVQHSQCDWFVDQSLVSDVASRIDCDLFCANEPAYYGGAYIESPCDINCAANGSASERSELSILIVKGHENEAEELFTFIHGIGSESVVRYEYVNASFSDKSAFADRMFAALLESGIRVTTGGPDSRFDAIEIGLIYEDYEAALPIIMELCEQSGIPVRIDYDSEYVRLD